MVTRFISHICGIVSLTARVACSNMASCWFYAGPSYPCQSHNWLSQPWGFLWYLESSPLGVGQPGLYSRA